MMTQELKKEGLNKVKNEVILVSPGPNSFFFRGIFYNNAVNSAAYRIGKSFIKQRPKRREAPLNILSIGTSLRNAGFTPRFIDGRFENVRKKLKQYFNDKTLFVGISAMTGSQVVFGLRAAKVVRKISGDIPIVWGGLHATVLPDETLKTGESLVDIVCRKEGEITVIELARALQNGQRLEGIKGVSYKDGKGGVVNNEDRQYEVFDKMPPMDFDLLDHSVYDLSYVTYQSSRGCPHRCKFCEVGPIHNRTYRARSPQTVIRDIGGLIKKYSTDEISLIDENFFVNLKNAREFANTILEKGLNFKWRAMSRADYFRRTDVDFWKLMRKAGCKSITIGAESGSQKMLDHMKKDYKVEDLTNAARQLSQAGIKSSFGFICGLPDEEKSDMDKTIKMVDHILSDYHRINIFEIFLYMPLPMTPYYEEIRRRGCEFPNRLEDWGTFLWGGKKYIKWHPLHEEAFRISLVSKWTAKPPMSRVFRSLMKLDIFTALMYLCGRIAWYRWKYKFFKFPVDIYLQYWLNRHIFKYLWQK